MLLGRLQEPVGGGAVPRAHLTVGLASGRPGWWGAVQVTGQEARVSSWRVEERVRARKGDAGEMVSHAGPLS